jgi:outer membrane protein assembly factor BamE (lipoprotein component of BamABCDE complex)
MSRNASLSEVLFIFCFSTILTGCQTARLKEFASIHGGMTKGEVLSAVGGPDRTQRWHGRDRWEYTLHGHPEGDIIREVHFENGRSTYVGPAIKPAISADEQDRINLLSNQAADLRDTESATLEREGISIQRFKPVDENANGKVGK